MSPIQLHQLQLAFPEMDGSTFLWLQNRMFLDELEAKRKAEEQAKREAEEQGKEAAKAFNAAFEKELEKLFK